MKKNNNNSKQKVKNVGLDLKEVLAKNSDNLANNIIALETIHNLSSERMAKIMEMEKEQYNFCLTCPKHFEVNQVEKLAEYFDCSIESLLSENEERSYSNKKEQIGPYIVDNGNILDAIKAFLKENNAFEYVSDILLRKGIPEGVRNTLYLYSEETKFRGELNVYARNRLCLDRSAYNDRPYIQFSNDNFQHYIGIYFDDKRNLIILGLHKVKTNTNTVAIGKYKGLINKALWDNLYCFCEFEIKDGRFDEERLMECFISYYKKMMALCNDL